MELTRDPTNIIVSGVGGQGNILASDIISRAFCREGCFISVGETYGATQRGGSVFSHIRLSNRRLYGPLIPLGKGHIIIGFEPLEVYRILLDCAGEEEVRVVLNDRPFYPLDTLQKKNSYPGREELFSRMGRLCSEVKVIQGTDLALKAGNPLTQNVVMVGAFAKLGWVPLPEQAYLEVLEDIFSGPRLEVNRSAFELGFRAALEAP